MKLPDFKTEEEEIKFWQKHSIGSYWADLKESDDTFKRPKLKPVTIKFDPLYHRFRSERRYFTDGQI